MTQHPKARRVLRFSLFLIAVIAFSGTVGWIGLRDGLGRLSERAGADLALASDRLTGQLQRFRELAVLLAHHPTLTPLAFTGTGDREAADALLLAAADRTGSASIVLLGRDGAVLASSDGTPVGNRNQAGTDYFRRAMQGTIGFHHAVEGPRAQRVFLYAVPVFSPQGPVSGAVVIRLDAEKVESRSRGEAQSVFFTDALGVVFVSNRNELLFSGQPPAVLPTAARALHYPDGVVHPFPAIRKTSFAGHDLWLLDGGPYLPRLALHLSQPLPVIEMQSQILLDAAPTFRLAALQAGIAAAACLVFGALLLVVSERRRALANQLEVEAASNAQLERRVADRTRDLSDAVDRLQREVTERLEAEAALQRAQNDLVRAGRLSALGQMSAGISHELNQPLMAIRSFAENAQALIARDQVGAASDNLGRISELARRMGRIIRNLRAFARAEVEALSDVDLGAVVGAVLEMTEARMRQQGVALEYRAPDLPVMVRGGEVRLQQVVMNLVANALDAMNGRAPAQLVIRVEQAAERITLRILDDGPGIAAPDRIFDPFYSTKEVGQAEGMGLGLSISYGIIQSFGGAIAGHNRPGGGAEFVVELVPAHAREAA